MLKRAHELEPLPSTAALGYAYGKAGRPTEALQMINDLDKYATTQTIPVYEKALVYLGMGRKDEVFRMLDVSLENHYPNLINLGIDPMYDELRTDPRFATLIERIGLPHSPSIAR